jgi:hypothetical protein
MHLLVVHARVLRRRFTPANDILQLRIALLARLRIQRSFAVYFGFSLSSRLTHTVNFSQ